MQELQFTAACLRVEPKNYHVWAHRQAVLLAAAAPEAWAAEAALIEQHLAPDVRNNSAWAQRAFLLRHWCAPSLFVRAMLLRVCGVDTLGAVWSCNALTLLLLDLHRHISLQLQVCLDLGCCLLFA